MFPERNIVSALVLFLPALTLSATEILLEPTGGRAILVDSDMIIKRSSMTTDDSDVSDVKQEQVAAKDVDDSKKVSSRTFIRHFINCIHPQG